MRRILPVVGCAAVLAATLLSMTPAGGAAADISAMLSRADAAEKSGDHAASIGALEQALEKVRAEAPLTANLFLLVTQPARFYGDYTPRANAVFQGGEALQFYLEPKNLVYPRTDAGIYEPAFEVDLQFLTATDEAVASQERFGSFRLPTRSPVQDIFLNLKVSLSGVPAGEYKVQFVVRDLNSKKTVTVTQPVTIK